MSAKQLLQFSAFLVTLLEVLPFLTDYVKIVKESPKCGVFRFFVLLAEKNVNLLEKWEMARMSHNLEAFQANTKQSFCVNLSLSGKAQSNLS